jgi:hypothetical protein
MPIVESHFDAWSILARGSSYGTILALRNFCLSEVKAAAMPRMMQINTQLCFLV